MLSDTLKTALDQAFANFDSLTAMRSLELVGDALRAKSTIPERVIRRFEAVAASEIEAAIRSTNAEISTWSHDLSVVEARDRVESMRVGLHRWTIAHGVSPSEIEGVVELAGRLAIVDRELATSSSRSSVEDALGDRAALLDARSWTAALRDDDPGSPPLDLPTEWTPAMADSEPSDEAITSYIQDGSFARYIETFAKHSPDFAETLTLLIEGARQDRDQVSLVARRWLRDRPFELVVGAEVLAAATEASVAVPRTVQLGVLGPARARLVITGQQVKLIVYAAVGSLREIGLGSNVSSGCVVASGVATWTVESPRVTPLRLRLVDGEGATIFDEDVILEDQIP